MKFWRRMFTGDDLERNVLEILLPDRVLTQRGAQAAANVGFVENGTNDCLLRATRYLMDFANV